MFFILTVLFTSTSDSFIGVRLSRKRSVGDCYSGTPKIGDVCSGGTIYAGFFNGHEYMVMPGGCGYEPSGTTSSSSVTDFVPTCSGTDAMTKFWNDGGTNPYFDIPGVENIGGNTTVSTFLGSVNTAAIVAITNPAEGGIHAAAMYCDRNAFGGFSDWYLPSKSEIAYLYCKSKTSGGASYPNEDPNCASYGYGTGTQIIPGFAAGNYHSSNEYSTGGGFSYKLTGATGQQANSAKNLALLVRCLREIKPTFVASFASPISYVSNLSVTGLDADYLGIPQSTAQSIVIKNVGDKNASGFNLAFSTYFEQVGGTCSSGTPLVKGTTCTIDVRSNASVILYNGLTSGSLIVSDTVSGSSMTVPLSGTASNYPDPCFEPGATIGLQCAGGTIFAGNFDGGNYMITPGGCEYEPSGTASSYSATDFTPNCSGTTDTMTKAWRGAANNYDIPGVENVTVLATKSSSSYRGDVNTAAIVAITNSAEGGYHPAARYCDKLDYGGHTDWYLPSKSELAFLYCKSRTSGSVSYPYEDPNCATYGYATGADVIPGFRTTSSYYWSSTESTATYATTLKISDGVQTATGAKSTGYYVRCVRRF